MNPSSKVCTKIKGLIKGNLRDSPSERDFPLAYLSSKVCMKTKGSDKDAAVYSISTEEGSSCDEEIAAPRGNTKTGATVCAAPVRRGWTSNCQRPDRSQLGNKRGPKTIIHQRHAQQRGNRAIVHLPQARPRRLCLDLQRNARPRSKSRDA